MKSSHLPRFAWLLLLFVGVALPPGRFSLTADARASHQVDRSDSQTGAYQFINGDFEQGDGVGWEEFSSSGTPVIVVKDGPSPITPYDDSLWMAWLGAFNDEQALISQWITVPADSKKPKLTYYQYVLSEEEICGYDRAAIYVNNKPLKYIDLCNDNNANKWVQQSHELLEHTGKLLIEFVIVTDDRKPSSWAIDDVTFVDETCRPLTLYRRAGQGSTPTAMPVKSPGCSTSGHYTAGQKIDLTAEPRVGGKVVGWSGTADDSSTDTKNILIMPAIAHKVSVTYDFEVTDWVYAPAVLSPKQ